MPKLPSLKPMISAKVKSNTLGSLSEVQSSLKRTLTGRALQTMRFAKWKEDPHCKMCGRLVAYPGGFELDHVVPNASGGDDSPSNLQILCVDEFEPEKGCHAVKTRQDLKDMRGERV